jgi:hypothetical protein
MSRFMLVGVAAVVMGAEVASAQLTLAIDVQGIEYQFRDVGGAAAFGGLSHSGTLEWTGAAAFTADTRIGSDGRFGPLAPVSQTVAMRDFTGGLTFDNGILTGGSFSMTLDNADEDTYTASIRPGTGKLGATNQIGYTIDGLTFNGAFSDTAWGAIDVTPWYDAQAGAGALPGAFFQFRFWPSLTAGGSADVEVFVTVPLPPAAWAGLVTLAGVGGLGYGQRRRRDKRLTI